MEPLICIPTYWTNREGKPTDRLFNIYDHPTPINQEGTLGRTLDSLKNLKGDFRVVIIGSQTESDLEEATEKKLKTLLKKYSPLKITFFSYTLLKTLHQRMEALGFKDLTSLISLEGYSSIRNLGLLTVAILGTDTLLFIDDDEVITDENYLNKALEFVGGSYENEKVYAKTGYYVKNEKGEFLSEDKVPWWDKFWKKGKFMNETLKNLTEGERLKKTPMALGGIMVLHREVFEKVPFDPFITRGEDLDYLINAKMKGYQFFFDKEVIVLHQPPPHLSDALGIRQDLYRFIYEREKLRYGSSRSHQVSLGELEPYPAAFLKSNLILKAFSLSLLTSFRDILQADFWGHLKNIKVTLRDARSFAKRNRHRYFGLLARWPLLIEALKEDKDLKEGLKEGQKS